MFSFKKLSKFNFSFNEPINQENRKTLEAYQFIEKINLRNGKTETGKIGT